MRLTIRKKMLLCSFFPVGILGIIIIIMASTSLRGSIINQVENSLRGTAAATLAAYDQNSGSYTMAENGDVWKGGYNISRSEKLLDTIKEQSGMEVTFFYGNKRIMTSAVDKNGDRILGSPAGEKVQAEVLEKGQEYFSKDVSLDGELYYGYYAPVFQSGDHTTPIGMVFAGVNKNETLNSVLKIVFYMIMLVLVIAAFGGITAGFVSNSVAKALNKGIACVEEVAKGNLNVNLESKYLNRKDEIGDLTKAIGKLQADLRNIIGGISDSTHMLLGASDILEQTNESAITIREAAEFISGIAEETNLLSLNASIEVARELEHARKEIVDVIERLSDIAQNNVASTQQTNSEINEVSEHFEDVEQSAANLRETATALEENIRNFKL